MNKNFTIITSSIFSAIFIFFVSMITNGFSFYQFCMPSLVCERTIGIFLLLSLIGPATLIQSILVRYLGNEEIQLKWKKVFRNFVIGYVLLLIILPKHIGDAFLGFDKDVLLLAYSALFLVVTLITTSIRIYRAKK